MRLNQHLDLSIYHKEESTATISFLIKKFILLQVNHFLMKHELRKHRFTIVTEVLLIEFRTSGIKKLHHKFGVVYLGSLDFHHMRFLISEKLLIITLEL